jgi:hypothetical protein
MICPACRSDARCVNLRPRQLVTLLGDVRLERHYYHCSDCRAGLAPWDDELGLQADRLSPAARQVVCLAGVTGSFAAAAERTLAIMAGLRQSESTVERVCEAAGAAVGARQATGETFGPDAAWRWHKDAEGKTCAVVSVDATGVPQQGPGGAKAEGRMAYVGMIYNPVPEDRERWANPAGRRPECQARYVASQTGGLDGLATPLRAQGRQVGMGTAERWLAIADGGSGIEAFLRVNFPQVEAIILDYFHVAEHLHDFTKVYLPTDPAAAKRLADDWCARLKAEGGAAVRQRVEALVWEKPSEKARAAQAKLLGYFRNQEHRMDYPAYLAKGWPIGSGPVESACKLVINQRLKGSGMRWGEGGSNGMAHLRALYRSEPSQWQDYWHPVSA